MMTLMNRRRVLFITLIIVLAVLAGVAFIHREIHRHDRRIIAEIGAVDTSAWPRPRVAIVFGASVYSSGDLSAMLEDRVKTAIELYRAGKVDRILVSGDNRTPQYNEPKAMADYLISHAVAPRDVVLDYAGRSTYETCQRAREIFGLQRALLVTQRFHLPRALYLAHQLGLDAFGVVADQQQYSSLDYQQAREMGAEIKAYLNVHVLPPNTVLGERLPIE
jgi:SanA protein